ncbi:MAG: type 4b pilus protein PilO2, partial [Lacisediminimonas sp.]|nr:type 4b pilus protein PilO2 [Lacisediminimonas sp.]
MSAVHLFEYQRGRPFICGLFWQPLPGVSPSQRKREMLRIAREQAFDLMVLPGTETAQVGYAAEKEGAQRGAVSVAAAFA